MAGLLVENYADIDALDETGSTPLQVAAEFFSLGVAAMLVASGATTDWSVLSQWLATRAKCAIDNFKDDIWEIFQDSEQE